MLKNIVFWTGICVISLCMAGLTYIALSSKAHSATAFVTPEAPPGVWSATIQRSWKVTDPTGERSVCIIGYYTNEFKDEEVSLLCANLDTFKRYKGNNDSGEMVPMDD